jgi:hypothetical protein
MDKLTAIIALVTQLLPALSTLLQNALAAFHANDQATLDALHLQATAMANALAPKP